MTDDAYSTGKTQHEEDEATTNINPNKTKTPWVNLFKDNRKCGDGIKLQSFQNLPEEVIFIEEETDNVEET